MAEFQNNTGVQPVPTGTKVDVRFRNGATSKGVPAGLMEVEEDGPFYLAYDWTIDGSSGDILQWRLAEDE